MPPDPNSQIAFCDNVLGRLHNGPGSHSCIHSTRTHVILQSTTIMHAGSVYDKDRCAECANKFIQYKDANMMSSGVKIKICSVPGNHNKGTQTIMLYATKPDMLLEMSTKFMKDHSQFMVKKEQDARQVIHKFYLSIKREDWTLDTMRDLYETVITNYNNTRNEVAWRGCRRWAPK